MEVKGKYQRKKKQNRRAKQPSRGLGSPKTPSWFAPYPGLVLYLPFFPNKESCARLPFRHESAGFEGGRLLKNIRNSRMYSGLNNRNERRRSDCLGTVVCTLNGPENYWLLFTCTKEDSMVLKITVVKMSVGKTKYTGFWAWTRDFGLSICFRAGKVIETFEKLFQGFRWKKKSQRTVKRVKPNLYASCKQRSREPR